jgi:C4-dicarboxylate transporter DctM subunit
MVPGMIQAGYDKRYAMGLVAASGTLGILIPPSITFVLFAIATDTSIGRLFTAGILPGIVLSIVLMIMAYVVAKIKGYGGEEKVSWSKRWKITFKALPGLFLPVIILGTIYGGIATPTESSILSVFYAILVSVFIYRELTWKQFQRSVREGVGITAMIFLIIAAASVFALFLTDHQIPKAIISWALKSGEAVTSVSFWIFTQLLFLVLGTFLEAVAIVLITLPILAPLAVKLDINLYHFAVVMVVNMELAMITPPVGLNLFVISTIARASLGDVVRGVAPFIVIMILVLILFVIFPQISLYLPDLIMGPLKSLR